MESAFSRGDFRSESATGKNERENKKSRATSPVQNNRSPLKRNREKEEFFAKSVSMSGRGGRKRQSEEEESVDRKKRIENEQTTLFFLEKPPPTRLFFYPFHQFSIVFTRKGIFIHFFPHFRFPSSAPINRPSSLPPAPPLLRRETEQTKELSQTQHIKNGRANATISSHNFRAPRTCTPDQPDSNALIGSINNLN